MKVADFVKIVPKFKGLKVGLEIEVEGKNLVGDPYLNPCWVQEIDPSLRGEAYEYILKKPLLIEEAKRELSVLKEVLYTHSQVSFSSRTSVHVHLNVADLEMQQLANLIYLYYIYEDVLLSYCGNDRYENKFCLSIRSAEALIKIIQDFFSQKQRPLQNHCKYAALNLAVIPLLGSLEFRGMRGTLEEVVLYPWLNVIQNLYKVALQYNNPTQILDDIQNGKLLELTHKVFKEDYHLFIKEGSLDSILYNVSICVDLVHPLTLGKD